MGNSASNEPLNVNDLMAELDRLAITTSPGVTVARKKIDHEIKESHPYKITLPVGDATDSIIKNLQVHDAGFLSMHLMVDTHIFNGTLKGGQWTFSDAIPIFKIHIPCSLTIYSQVAVGAIHVEYDTYCNIPLEIKERCANQDIISGSVMYHAGCAY